MANVVRPALERALKAEFFGIFLSSFFYQIVLFKERDDDERRSHHGSASLPREGYSYFLSKYYLIQY